MPSWDDGETSSEEPLSNGEFDGEFANPDVPETLHDPDFCGIDTHYEATCDHFDKMERFVAFEGVNTGRRFLGCARREMPCPTVQWLDAEWPDNLKKCLARIWELYHDEYSAHIRHNCEHANRYYNLNLDKKALEEKNKMLMVDLGKAISESGLVPSIQLKEEKKNLENIIAEMFKKEDKALKEIEELKEERKKLKHWVGEMFRRKEEALKEVDVHKTKLKKLKEILDE